MSRPASASSYAETGLTTPSRHAERARHDAATVHGILDAALIGHLAYVVDGRPFLLPMLYVRIGSRLYLHSSTGAHPARLVARSGRLSVAFEVTIVDGLVLARSAFSHSANYRSVVAHGDLVLEPDPERKDEVLKAFVDKVVPGRASDARPPTPAELRQTAVLALDLDEVGAKVRTGGPLDEDEDLSFACWAGVVPIERRFGRPDPANTLELPAYLAALEGAPTFT